MKLSQMSVEDKIKTCAELDGWKLNQFNCWTPDNLSSLANANHNYQFPNYATSYDAIIPLIQKQIKLTQCLMGNYLFGSKDEQELELENIFDATPSQLLDALLIATGKAEL